jgi:hypothetical protein
MDGYISKSPQILTEFDIVVKKIDIFLSDFSAPLILAVQSNYPRPQGHHGKFHRNLVSL